MQRSNPRHPPPVLELIQRSVRGQCLSQRFAGLVSKAVSAKTEGKQNDKGGEVSTADPDALPLNKQQNRQRSNPGIPPVLEPFQRSVRGQCLSQRFARLVSEAVNGKTEGSKMTRGEKSAQQTPMFCPKISSRTHATADRQRSNPGIPPVLEPFQRSVRGQCLSQRFARLVSEAVNGKTEGSKMTRGEKSA